MRRVAARIANRAAIAAGVALALALLVVPIGIAADPQRLASPVTDDAGVLPSGMEASIQAAFDRVQAAHGVQPWIWYLDTTNGADPAAFATDTARASGLGGADLLLVIAMQDHAYGYWKGDAVPISDADLELLLSKSLPANLRANDPGAAAIAFADELDAALSAGKPTPAGETPAATPAAAPAAPGGGDTTIGTLLAIVLVVAGAALIIWWLSTHREATGNAPGAPGQPRDDLAGLSPKDLEALANSLLLQADDAVRDSEQELGFAQAQFGDEAAAPFAKALDEAKADLKAAFTIRQQLDDATPETPVQRRPMLEQLVRDCRSAQVRLDDQKERFDQLRAMQEQAPGILAALPAQADALATRAAAAAQTMARLQQYADADWQAVAPNVDEAAIRIAAVRAAVDAGQSAVTAGESPKAAAAAQAGQDALAQGTRFLDAIDALALQLEAARTAVASQLATSEQDVARAKQAASGGGIDPSAAARVARAEALLSEARTALDPPKPDVTGALDKAREAEKVADEVLAQIRSAQEAAAQQAAQLASSLDTARVAVTRAAGLVGTRQGAVGAQARTRLAEAQRHLDQATALASTDRLGAIREADTAGRLAAETEALAQRDYQGWNDPWRSGGGGAVGGGTGGNAGSDVAGAIIGGIIGGILAGGGRRGGGPFGGGGGFGGGWGGGGFGGGGFGGGGFGGSSGGGGFGGGGGSSGSGRW